MLCRVLGPLEVSSEAGWTTVGAPKWRALLATLVMQPGQLISTGQLVDELWGDDPPPGARKLVSGYVLQLRRLIGDPDGRVLVTQSPGYRLMIAAADVDVVQFEKLVAAGRRALADQQPDQAAELLTAALDQWRGSALADVPRGPLVAAGAVRLEELRLDALELRIETEISLGRPAELVAELRQLTARYPLRERFWHQLMRVLAHSGRPAEALAAYAQAQQLLVGELGANPGPDLQQLHRRLLAGDRAPAAKPATAPTAKAAPAGGVAAAPAVLRQLPATVAHFAGRAAELAALTGPQGQVRAGMPGTVVILAIDGMPGVGKTALALQAAHLMADQFPDRQLFVDLHGHTPARPPADPVDVLSGLLAADGVDPRYLPADLDGRAAMWRDRMAGLRVLLILDNAADTAQVAPLLPGTAGCLVLVTSRRYLGDLPAAVEVPLDILPPGGAGAMFTALAPRAASDPDRLAELVALCGHLPLAVSLLARLFARHRAWSMADLIAQTRARLLTVTAENRTVAAAFELSYQDLSPERQRFFRCLGLHPGREIDAYAAAALTGLSPDEVTGHLDALHRDRLVEEPAPHRYGMHDLIGQYARSLAAAENADQRNQAAGRLLDYYQQTAEAADVYLTRYARAAAARPALAVTAAPALPDLDRALAWMTAERASLLACIDDAAARHDHGRVIALTAAIASHLRSDGPWPLAIRLHTSAVRAAQHLDDRFGEASALNDLGDMWLVTGDYRQATGVLEQALDISRSIGDELGEANALLILGTVRKLTGERLAAAAALEQALDIYRRIGSRLGEANALANLGDVRREANEYAAAADALGQALNICRDTGDRSGEANSLFYLAVVRHATDDMPGATALLNQALAIYRRIGSRLGEANALYSLGDAQRLTGDPAGAAEVLQKALAIYRRIGSRLGEANALYSLGDAQRLTGDPAGAAEMLQQALAIYRDIGDQLGEANILCRLADAWLVAGDIPGAAAMLEKALPIYRHIGERPGETAALNQTGAVHLARGNPQLARTCHLSALELARAIDSQLEEARALEGIGKCTAIPPAADTADDALRQALEIFQRLGAPDAVRLAAEMAALPAGAADTPSWPTRA